MAETCSGVLYHRAADFLQQKQELTKTEKDTYQARCGEQKCLDIRWIGSLLIRLNFINIDKGKNLRKLRNAEAHCDDISIIVF